MARKHSSKLDFDARRKPETDDWRLEQKAVKMLRKFYFMSATEKNF